MFASVGRWIKAAIKWTAAKLNWTFDPIRGPELVVCIASTWWLFSIEAFNTANNSVFRPLERTFATGDWLEPFFIAAALLFWLNFYRVVDDVRETILFFAIMWWATVASLVIIDRPTSPSVAVYVGMAYLSIINYIRSASHGSRL